ncbi:MAG: peptidylprolyl isomerase [Sphingomonadaceae bacterium]|nr:peptidylprolyl isomerase [Sphingomonadaceae bacterium]
MKHALLLALFAPAMAFAQTPDTEATPETPSDVIAAATAADWRPIAPENLLVMTMGSGAEVFIELAPDFARVHVENIRSLARAGWYDGISVNRVQDNYVVQWGDASGEKPLPEGVVEQPPAEYHIGPVGRDRFPLTVVSRGGYTRFSGYVRGWPVGTTGTWPTRRGRRIFGIVATLGDERASLIHCYGMVGVGRGNNPDTGTGAELYTVIGHAPRHLDRNIALVGRIVEGIEHLSSLPRGTGPLGFYEEAEQRVPIATMRLASELPEADRPRFQVMRTDTETFRRYVHARANRTGWFIRPAGAVDVCNVNLPIRRVVE